LRIGIVIPMRRFRCSLTVRLLSVAVTLSQAAPSVNAR
jgi:hypothetical protein